ncbi:MAG: 5'/3'-nucleotidase SurE [Candidatus Omnitrophica bacterium]|nr:5'/3'-nucleotidase SurE [Candidatus Omnitrophota bacterium]MCM8802761.1 5'/3'-nucleotidase SurE [Candidatus Omnitrophota bacterium]
MNILLTNDDGIFSDGLRVLWKYLSKKFKVYVVVPEVEKSATSHSINLLSPIRIKKVKIGNFFCYIVSGTPVDCVKIGVKELIKKKIDMVISGINPGPNLGMDILYSGTVSAACEGAILGISSIAVSIANYKDFNFVSCSKVVLKIIDLIKNLEFPKDTILNINVPNKKIKGIKITYQSKSRFNEEYEKRTDPRGNLYFWLKGNFDIIKEEKESDVDAIKNGYVSITPIQLNLTNFSFLEELKKTKIEKLKIK